MMEWLTNIDLVALWGAAVSTVLAIREIAKSRTKIEIGYKTSGTDHDFLSTISSNTFGSTAMSAIVDTLVQQAKELPEQDRLALLDALFELVSPTEPAVEQAWKPRVSSAWRQ
jgi:hypothetical protein